MNFITGNYFVSKPVTNRVNNNVKNANVKQESTIPAQLSNLETGASIYNKANINFVSFKGQEQESENDLWKDLANNEAIKVLPSVYKNLEELSSAKNDTSIAEMICYGYSTPKLHREFLPVYIATPDILTEENYDFAKELMTAVDEKGNPKYYDGKIHRILSTANEKTIPWIKDNMDFVVDLTNYKDHSESYIQLDSLGKIVEVCALKKDTTLAKELMNLGKKDNKGLLNGRQMADLLTASQRCDAEDFIRHNLSYVDSFDFPIVAYSQFSHICDDLFN